MIVLKETHSIDSPSFVSRAGSAAAIAVGLIVLGAWAFDVEILKHVSPGLVSMKANTALAFILSGAALWLLQTDQTDTKPRLLSRACSSVVVAIGLLTLIEYLLGYDLGVDQLLFTEPLGAIDTSSPGRMSPATALYFLLIGCALLLSDTRRGILPSQCLTLSVAAGSAIALVGYAYDVKSLYSISVYTGMALHTVLTFLVLCVGILAARPARGLMRIVTGEGVGSAMARRLVLFAILLPLVGGWLRVKGQEAGFFGTGFGTALFAVTLMIVFVTVIGWTARSLTRLDDKRRRAEAELERFAKSLEQRVAERTEELAASRVAALNMMEDAEEARKKAEQASAQFRVLLESAPDAHVIINQAGSIMRINYQTEKLFGYTRQELLGESIERLVPDRFRERHVNHRAGFFAHPQGRAMGMGRELYALRKDNSEFPTEISLSPLETDQGLLVIAAIRDITERKRAEQELGESEVRLRAILENSPGMVFLKDVEGRYLHVNHQFERAFRMTREQIVGKTDADIFAPEQASAFHANDLKVFQTGVPLEFEEVALHADGSHTSIVSKFPLCDADGKPFGLCGITTDITERKRAEEDLRKSEEKYRTLFDSIDEGFCTIEMLFDENKRPVDYRFLEVNPSFEKHTGIQNACGRRMREIAPLHEEHWFETYGRIALTGEPARFENEAAQLHRWYDVYAFRIGEPQERQVAILFKNITERKRAEEALRRAHAELEQRVEERTAELSKRTRDLETMLYVTSHDLREPLRSIENFSRMVHDRYAGRLDNKGKDFLHRVMRSAQRMDRLMTDLLALSRVQRMDLPTEEVEGEWIVEEALRRLDDRLKETGARVQIIPLLPRLKANSVWAIQGVYNLLTNAIKFTRPQASPDIEIAAYVPNGTGPVEVGLVVRDRGPGVAPEHAERIFQLFQRAVGREVEGTGAGLAIVRQVAERHGGRAWVQPRAGGGSEFILTFGTVASIRET